ncbi:hypothetical protein [Runella salmonicolor]|uniref:Uncharacterized protein n=1 Tax=Runella salmonicolor TaxID=2950278 RepID=A0ABT1FSR6_9BACT|nr:hypothetical protein [Runella salmonicolor]MCP1384805.1 hypothetical protein [Runella salmonicolor]
MAVFLPFFGYGQIINESIVRASIASNIPTNANKQITAAMLRPVLGQIVTLITNGSNGVVSDSLATVNYIPFFKTTGKIANSPFRVASNNVGLGINPVYPLQILGTLSASQFRVGNTIIADTTATETRLYRRNGKVGLKLGGSNFTNHYENYIHVFRLQDSGEEFARLSYNGGLEVRALGNRTLFQAGYIVTTDTLGTFVPSYSWAKDFTFATDPAANYPTTRMVIKVNGLVGIGRTTPVYGLDVARSFRADSSVYLATIAANRVGIGNTSPVYKLDVTGDLRGTTNAYFATSSGRVGIRRTSPTYMLDVAGTMRSDSSTYLATLVNTGVVIGSTAYIGYKLDVEGWTRTKANTFLATDGGDVGIGTTSPTAKLNVVGTTLLDGTATLSSYLNLPVLGSGAVAARGVAFQGNEYVMGYGTEGVAGSNIIGPVYSRVDYGPYSYRWGKHTGAALLADGSNFTTQMVLTNAGNVGINVPSPSFKLEVAGTVGIRDGLGVQVFRDGSNSINNHLYFANTANNRAYNWQLNEDGSAATFWGFTTGVGWNRLMSVNSNGNVGVNVDTPTSRIDVDGTDGFNQIRARKSATPSATAATDGNTGNIVWDDNYIYIKTSAGWKRAALSTF